MHVVVLEMALAVHDSKAASLYPPAAAAKAASLWHACRIVKCAVRARDAGQRWQCELASVPPTTPGRLQLVQQRVAATGRHTRFLQHQHAVFARDHVRAC